MKYLWWYNSFYEQVIWSDTINNSLNIIINTAGDGNVTVSKYKLCLNIVINEIQLYGFTLERACEV